MLTGAILTGALGFLAQRVLWYLKQSAAVSKPQLVKVPTKKTPLQVVWMSVWSCPMVVVYLIVLAATIVWIVRSVLARLGF